MKISTKNDFQPVTIVIETQAEADLLAVAVGAFSGSWEGDMLYKIFCALDREHPKYKVSVISSNIREA